MDLDQTQALDEPWQASEPDNKTPLAWVTVLSSSDVGGEKHPVYTGTTVIGRDPSCEICIPSKKLSKVHAAIEVEDDIHFLHDMNSHNRTRFGDFLLKPHVRYELTPARQSFVLGNVECRYSICERSAPAAAAGGGSDTESETGDEAPFVLDTTSESPEGDKVLVENSFEDDNSEPPADSRKSTGLSSNLPRETSTPRSHQTQATLVLPESEQDLSDDVVQAGVYHKSRRLLDSQPESESPDIGGDQNVIPNSPQAPGQKVAVTGAASSGSNSARQDADATQPTLMLDAGMDTTADQTQATLIVEPPLMVDAEPTQPTQAVSTVDGGRDGAEATLPTQPFASAGTGADVDDATPPTALDETQPTQLFEQPPADEFDSDASEPMLPCEHDQPVEQAMEETEPTLLQTGDDEADGGMLSTVRAVGGQLQGAGAGAGTSVDDPLPFEADDAATLAYDVTNIHGNDDGDDTDTTGPSVSGDVQQDENAYDDEPTQAYVGAEDSDENEEPAVALPADDEPTQAYGVLSDGSGNDVDDEPTQAYGVLGGGSGNDVDDEPTQAYGVLGGGSDNDADDPTQAYGLEGGAEADDPTQAYGLEGGAEADDPTQAYGLEGDAEAEEATQAYGLLDDEGASPSALGNSPANVNEEEPTMAYGLGEDVESQEYGVARVVTQSETSSTGTAEVASPSTSSRHAVATSATASEVATGANRPAVAHEVVGESQAATSPVKPCLPGLRGAGRGAKRKKHVLFADEANSDEDDKSEEEAAVSAPPSKRSRTRAGPDTTAESSAAPKAAGRRGRSSASRQDDDGSSVPTTTATRTAAVEVLTSAAAGRGRRGKTLISEPDSTTQQQDAAVASRAGEVEEVAEVQASTTSPRRGRRGIAAVSVQKSTMAPAGGLSSSASDRTNPEPAVSTSTPPSQRLGRRAAAAAAEPKSTDTQVEDSASTDTQVEDSASTAGEQDTEAAASVEAATTAQGRGRKARTITASASSKPQESPVATKSKPADDAVPSSTQRRGKKGRLGSSDSAAGKDEAASPAAISPAALQAPALQRGRSSSRLSFEQKPDSLAREIATEASCTTRVMMTGIINEELRSIVAQLGGKMEDDNVRVCTHLVTDRIARTIKFLSCLAMGKPIVTTEWLVASKKAKRFLDHGRYTVKDQEREATFKFNLEKSRKKAAGQLLFEGQKLFLCASVRPPPEQMAEIVKCGGGEVLASFPSKSSQNAIVVAAVDDQASINKSTQSGHAVVSPEYVLTGVLRQSTSVDEYRLAAVAASTSTAVKRKSSATEAAEKPASKRGRRKR